MPNAFSGLSDQDLACLYRALCTYVMIDADPACVAGDPAAGPLAERSALYRVGAEAQREIDRRGRDRVRAHARQITEWVFESEQTYLDAVRRAMRPASGPPGGP